MSRVLFALALACLLVAPSAFAAGDAAAGKTFFTAPVGLCYSCHGEGGKGDGPAGAALNPPPRDFTEGAFKFDADKDGNAGTDADLALVIKEGAGPYGGNPSMASWKSALSEKDVENVIAYIRTLKK